MNKLTQYKPDHCIVISILFVTFPFLVWMVYSYLPVGSDWVNIYRPAALNLIALKSPYGFSFVNPPWALLPLIPFALLPWRLGGAVLSVLGMFVFAYVAIKLQAKPISLIIILISIPVIHHIIDPGVDWLVAIGFALPPQVGLFFVLVKPQVGIAVALFWIGQSWKIGGWQKVLSVFAPVTLMYILSFFVFGFHPILGANLINVHYNVSLWPWSIPVGLLLVALAVKYNKIKWSMLSSPLLAPYIALHSLHGGFLALVKTPLYLVIAVAIAWYFRLN